MRTRLAQQANKRLDRLAYTLGYDFSPGKSSPHPSGEFFFGGAELPDRVACLKEYLPEEASEIENQARKLCQHRFNLLGYTDLDYGKEIDWHLDVVHGKRAPLKPWYMINFLDFDAVGDHKVTWELNRHQHLVTLGKAWALSRNSRYALELVDQWYSWRRANPYPLGINWASSLEVAFRSLSWIWVQNLVDDAAPVPVAFRADLERALALNGRYIEKYLSIYFSPNTHLLGEAVALFFIGALYPGLPRARQWRDQGWRLILEAAERQVRPDGVYFEQALHYHVYALDFFLHARILAAKNKIAIPADFDAILEKMLDVVEALSQAGPAEGFGDDDGGRVFHPRRNQTEHMTDPLAIGAALYGRERIRASAELTEEAIWLLGHQATEAVKGQSRPPLRSRAFPAGGVYVMAGAWPCPHQMVVDAGPQGIGRSGHGHADALSIRMAVDGRRLLTDPGTSVYISDSNDREEFRGTGAHNTVLIDGQDQAVPAGPFAWDAIPATQLEGWSSGEFFDFLRASHNGYRRLVDPVIHHRSVFRGPDGICVVRDLSDGQGRHLIESFWHFGEDIQVAHEGPALIAGYGASPSRLGLVVAGSCDWQLETGSGFVSPAYGSKKPAAMARISGEVTLPAQSAVLIDLNSAARTLGQFSYSTDPETRNVDLYEYVTREALYRFFFSRGDGDWSAGEWTSDARFLYCVSLLGPNRGDDLSEVVLVAGSFARRRGVDVVAGERMVEQWEWTAKRGKKAAQRSALEFAER